MTPDQRDEEIRKYLEQNKIADLKQLKAVAGNASRMTAIRALERVGYLTSYSHRGGFYTLQATPHFDQQGLWTFEGVGFSKFGSLLNTVHELVEASEYGYCAAELEDILSVEVKHALLQLDRRGEITREEQDNRFVYFSQDRGNRRQQKLMRQQQQALEELHAGVDWEAEPEELKAGIILFFSLLNERQRRLYAGLEAARLGHGGDRKISQLLGLDPHTVAKGRREIFAESFERGHTRKPGAGRRRVEKKRQK